MSRIRNLGDGLVNNLQNNYSQPNKKPKEAQKDQTKERFDENQNDKSRKKSKEVQNNQSQEKSKEVQNNQSQEKSKEVQNNQSQEKSLEVEKEPVIGEENNAPKVNIKEKPDEEIKNEISNHLEEPTVVDELNTSTDDVNLLEDIDDESAKDLNIDEVDILNTDENLYEEDEININDGNLETISEEIIEEINKEDLVSEEFVEEINEEDLVSEEIVEEINEEDLVSEEIVEEINEEDLVSEEIVEEINNEDLINESKGIENMNKYRTPNRKKKEELYDDSPDVIVPISAEIRNNRKNNYYEEEGDYISPISEEEYEEYYDDELEDLLSENESNSVPEDFSNPNEEAEINDNQGQAYSDADSPYYYSAVGIENALKKNAVQYPKNNDRNKGGIAGTVSSIKNEMLYLKASMDEIENPTEREMVYVIDRSADDEFFEDPYDPYEETVVIDNTQNAIPKDDSYESMFTAKKHEYLDKIEEYTNSTTDEAYSAESNGSYLDDITTDTFTDDIDTIEYIGSETEPIIPIDSPLNQSTTEYQSTEEYSIPAIDTDDSIGSVQTTEDIDSEFEEIDDIELDDDLFEDIISDVGQDYQDLENERIKEANVLSAVDNTRLTPTGELEDYIEEYKEIEDIIIKSPAEIYDDEKKLATAVMDIVAAEGPIHVETVIRRLRESCGLSRAGTKFKNAISAAINRNEANLNLIREEDFLFIDYDSVKVRKRVKPNIDLISEVEIEKAIDLVLSFEKSLKVNELTKKVSRAFGFRSTSKKTSNRITLVIDAMIGKGILINTHGKIEFR